MDQPTPLVSVIVAAYSPGDAVNRLVDSLDAQTLPASDFEVIFVDDGSPDDTYERLERIAATRPNVRLFHIENSGWPSRPRNIGIDNARGKYVLFMDHDDALYPDGLRRAFEYATENDADVVNIQEYNTKQVWWMPRLKGNIPNALTDGGIERLMPFMPHKLYRRQLLLDHDIRFPERARALWEDWYINVGVYRYSRVVSVLADTPFYLRHIHGTNTSHTFNPTRPDYWERLDDVMRYIVTTLDGPEYKSARTVALARHMILRVLQPLGKLATAAEPEVVEASFGQARRLLGRYTSDDVFGKMSKTHRAQAYLLRTGQPGLMKEFHALDQLQRSQTRVVDVDWRDGILVAELECVWEPNSDEPIFRRDGKRIVRAVSPELQRAIPAELLDVGGDAKRLGISVRVRNRADYVSWDVTVKTREVRFDTDEFGTIRLVARGEATLDTETGAYGAALARSVWDFRVRTTWQGMSRDGNLLYSGPARPLMHNRRGSVAYANNSQGLSLDLAHQLRTLAIDAGPRLGPVGPMAHFTVLLENLPVFGGAGSMPAPLFALDEALVTGDTAEAETQRIIEELGAAGDLNARIVADVAGTRLEGGSTLGSGTYRIYTRLVDRLHPTRLWLTVDEAGQAILS